jgi:hypothetical protein
MSLTQLEGFRRVFVRALIDRQKAMRRGNPMDCYTGQLMVFLAAYDVFVTCRAQFVRKLVVPFDVKAIGLCGVGEYGSNKAPEGR